MWMTVWLQLKQQRVSDEMISQEILEAEGANKNEKAKLPKTNHLDRNYKTEHFKSTWSNWNPGKLYSVC